MNREKTTLILKEDPVTSVNWSILTSTESRVIPVANLAVLSNAIRIAHEETPVHVARVLVDATISAEQWLDLIASLPLGFRADLLWIHDDRHGYLSAVGRGGDRVLYRLEPEDVDFYLQTVGISSGPDPLYLTGFEPSPAQIEAFTH